MPPKTTRRPPASPNPTTFEELTALPLTREAAEHLWRIESELREQRRIQVELEAAAAKHTGIERESNLRQATEVRGRIATLERTAEEIERRCVAGPPAEGVGASSGSVPNPTESITTRIDMLQREASAIAAPSVAIRQRPQEGPREREMRLRARAKELGGTEKRGVIAILAAEDGCHPSAIKRIFARIRRRAQG